MGAAIQNKNQIQQGGKRCQSQANWDLSTLRPGLTAILARAAPSTGVSNKADIAYRPTVRL